MIWFSGALTSGRKGFLMGHFMIVNLKAFGIANLMPKQSE
jgi:hypothetical protein